MAVPLVQSASLLEAVLLVRAHAWYCAIPVASVTETCRPLPVQPVEGMPAFVRGITVMRGKTTPVIHLGMMLAGGSIEPGRRFVAVQVRGSPLVFEVDETVGVRHIPRSQLDTTTPLTHGGATDRLDGVGVFNNELLAWLDTARIVQDDLLDLVLSEGWT